MFRNMPGRRSSALALLLLIGLTLPNLSAAPPTQAQPRWLLSAQPLLVIQAEQPALVAKQFLRYATLPELMRFPAYRELLESTGQRRFLQLLGYLEKELGAAPEELLDRLAGGGILFGLELLYAHPFASPEPRFTLQLRGRDPQFTQKAVALLTELGTQELARQESKDKYEYENFEGVKITRLGNTFAFAVVDADVVASNQLAGVKAAISRAKQITTTPLRVLMARRNLKAQPLAWLWADLKKAKGLAGDGFKKGIELPTNEFVGHVVFGGWLDVIRRADEVTAAVSTEGDDLILTTTLPAGQEGMSAVMKSVFARPLDEPGVRPFFDFSGALFQTSFCYYPGGFIDHLDEFVTESVRKEFTDFNKKSKPFLVGHTFSDMVKLLGKRHQFIVARQRDSGYKIQPRDRYPAFGAVVDLKEPARFDKEALPIIRAAGFLAALNISMKFTEEKIGDYKLIGYRFVENEKNKERDHGVLFNFSPCMVRIGDQVIFASTFELARDLAPVVKEHAGRTARRDEASARHRFSWEGLGYYFDGVKGQVLAQIVLSDGSTFAEAERQMDDLKKLFQRLGTVDAAVFYDKNAFRLELRTRLNPATTAQR